MFGSYAVTSAGPFKGLRGIADAKHSATENLDFLEPLLHTFL